MNWSDERYVKLYTRQTATWRLWPWQARCLFPLMLQVADGAGLIGVDCEDPIEGVAALVMIPREVVEEGIKALEKSKTLSKVDGGFLIINFIEAQEAVKTDKLRQADLRQRRRDQARLQEARHATSRDVEGCHALSPSSLAYPSLAKPRSTTQTPMSTSSTAGLPPAGEQPPLVLVSPTPPAPTVADEVREVFEAWKSTMKHPKATLDDKRQRLIRARLKDGYSTADLKQAILGCSLTPFNRGDNKTKTIYDGLGLILRDSEHVDRFMANAARPPTHADACPNDITPEAREFFASAPTDADLEF